MNDITPRELVEVWRVQAELSRQTGDAKEAKVLKSCADELEEVLDGD